MKQTDEVMLKAIHVLEKGIIPPSRGWTVEKAGELIAAVADRPKLAFPPNITDEMVYEVIREVLMQLEDAEEQYVPKWAKLLRS